MILGKQKIEHEVFSFLGPKLHYRLQGITINQGRLAFFEQNFYSEKNEDV